MKGKIDVPKALFFRKSGMKWNEIGVALAHEDGREPPYQGRSVQSAVFRASQQKEPRT